MGRWVPGLLAVALLAACDPATPAPKPPTPPKKKDPPKVEPLKPGQDPTAKFDPKAPGAIKGRVVDEDGKPVADLAVDLLGAEPPADPSEEEKPLASTKTSAEGRFDFKTDGEATFRLRFERIPSPDNPAFTASPYFNNFPFLVFGGQTLDLGDLLHRRWGATFDVSCLTNPDGHPVGGVTVWLWQPETSYPNPEGAVGRGTTDKRGHALIHVPGAYAGQTYVAAVDDKEHGGFGGKKLESSWETTLIEVRTNKGRGGWNLKDELLFRQVKEGETVKEADRPRAFLTPSAATVTDSRYCLVAGDRFAPLELKRNYPFKNPVICGPDGYFRCENLEVDTWLAVSEWKTFKNYEMHAYPIHCDDIKAGKTAAGSVSSALSSYAIEGTLDFSIEGVALKRLYQLQVKLDEKSPERGFRIGLYLINAHKKDATASVGLMRPTVILELKDEAVQYRLDHLFSDDYYLLVGGVIGDLSGRVTLMTFEAPAFVVGPIPLSRTGAARFDIVQNISAAQLSRQYWLPAAVFENQWNQIKRRLASEKMPFGR